MIESNTKRAAKAEPSPVGLSKTEQIRAEAEAAAIARVHAICGSPEGLSNPDYAGELALDMNLSVAEALTRLKTAASWNRASDNINRYHH